MGCCGTLESDAGGAWWELPGKSWDHRRHLTGGRAAMIGEQSQRKGREMVDRRSEYIRHSGEAQVLKLRPDT